MCCILTCAALTLRAERRLAAAGLEREEVRGGGAEVGQVQCMCVCVYVSMCFIALHVLGAVLIG